jgi:D-alanyl-D-alanine carboxypeptidase
LPSSVSRGASAFLLLVLLSLTPGSQLAASSLGRGFQGGPDSLLPGQLAAGTSAVVRADGDCLRIREQPGLTAPSLTCIPEGAVVQVLAGRELVDGYHWQRVQSGAFTGWAAEIYLQPAGTTSNVATCPATGALASAPSPTPTPQPVASTTGSIEGEIPATGGYDLVVWGGGTAEEMGVRAAAEGCRLSAVWATSGDGALLVYIFGALDVVNQAWLTTFPGGAVPAGTGVLLVCGASTASALAASPLEDDSGTIDPASWTSVESPLTAAPAYNSRTAVVLHGRDAHLPVPPASLTKIVVAILAIEYGDLDAWVQTDVDSRKMPGSSLMGLLPGDCFRLRDLVYGLMLPSGNDAALAIGRFIAGSDAAFVGQMNGLMARLGLVNSSFVNAHGLDASGHTASAYDLAMVARYGMTLPFFAQVVGTTQWTAKGSRTINLPNVNGFLSAYRGADGVKTGYTGAAGRTLVASATRNGARVFITLMNAPNRVEDAARLMDWAFQNSN